MGATVEVPRVGYPCLYVSQRFCADHGLLDALANVDGAVYPVIPCVMDPSYCTVSTGVGKPLADQPGVAGQRGGKTRFRILDPSEAARIPPATVLRLRAAGLNPRKFGGGLADCDLDHYLHEQLDGAVLQPGQAFQLLCNGRETRFEVVNAHGEAERLKDCAGDNREKKTEGTDADAVEEPISEGDEQQEMKPRNNAVTVGPETQILVPEDAPNDEEVGVEDQEAENGAKSQKSLKNAESAKNSKKIQPDLRGFPRRL